MSIKPNRVFNNPEIGAAMNNIASMFAPPESGDLANWSLARERNQKSDIVQKLAGDPRYQSFDHQTLLGGSIDSWQDSEKRLMMDDATSRANNLQDNQFSTISSLYGSQAQGNVRPPVPTEVSDFMQLPALPGVSGAPKPLSETELKADWLQDLMDSGKLSQDDVATQYRSGTNIEEVIGPDGKPLIASRDAAIGMQPVPKSPSTTVQVGPNGEPLGSPGDGLVWQRGADGQVVIDDRGAPIAIPYQGGKAFEEQRRREEAAAAGETKDTLKSSVVLQNLDRALDAIEANPTFTTGLGAQATGWLGGSPARALESVLAPISANIGFDQLQAMRDASPTGGALGQVTERELAFLQSVLGNIDLEAGPQVIDDIKRLKNIYLDTVHGVGNGERERLSFPSQWDQHADNGSGTAEPEVFAVNPQTGERRVFRNGEWVLVESGR